MQEMKNNFIIKKDTSQLQLLSAKVKKMLPIWKNGTQCKPEQPQSLREQLKDQV